MELDKVRSALGAAAITSLFKLAQALENHWHISFQL
jgi:hypothetical protein